MGIGDTIRYSIAFGLGLAAAWLLAGAASARAETHVSLYLGHSFTARNELGIVQPSTSSNATFSGVKWDDQSLRVPLYYGFRAEQWFGRGGDWGSFADFTHYKVFADGNASVTERGTWQGVVVDGPVRFGDRVQGFSMSHGTNHVGVGVLRRWLLGPPRPNRDVRRYAYFGGGPIVYILHVEADVNGVVESAYQNGGLGFQLLGGFSVAPARHLRFFGETRFDHGTPDVEIGNGGRASVVLSTFHLVIGTGYRF